MYQRFLMHMSPNGHLGCTHVQAIINSAVMNIGVHMFLSIPVSLVCMITSGIASSYGGSVSSFLFYFFLTNLHTFCHSSNPSLQSHQQCKRDPFSPRSLQNLLSVYFWIVSILNSMTWSFTASFILSGRPVF